MLLEAVRYYHNTLLESQTAKDYLRSRGIYDEEAIKTFQLGFCDGSFSENHMPKSSTYRNRRKRWECQQEGILAERGHERYKPGITFPIYDRQGNLVQVYGRKVSQQLKSKKYHAMANDRVDVVWNRQGLGNEIILCKGLIDALTFWVAGYRNVTALLGSQNLTDEHLKTFKECGVMRVYLAFGGKRPDQETHIQVGTELQKAGFVVFRMIFPRGMDPNDYHLKSKLNTVIQTAQKEDFFVATSPETVHVEDWAGEPETNQPEPEPELEDGVLTLKGEEIHVRFGDVRYRVRGLFENLTVDSMRVNLRVTLDDRVFVDNVELYAHRQRQIFMKQAALELGILEDGLRLDLARLIVELEKLQDSNILETMRIPQISEEDREAALDLLNDPHLMKRIASDLELSGLVGEEENKLVGYLAMVSRKLSKPLALLIQSTSAAGKSSLLDTLLGFVPEEDRLKFSSITSQSLFYMAERGMKNKVLAVVEGEGAANASYSLKLLQSEGELSISSAGGTRKGISAKSYNVQGPVMIAMTTTAVSVDDELLNRCIVLTVDESRRQTRAIHRFQRETQTLEGILAREHFNAVQKVHQNAQRLLEPVYVVNPLAPQLTFLDEKTRLRRDHVKYLNLIQAIAFIHQHQRKKKRALIGGKDVPFIEVQVSDIEIANRLAHHVLGVTLDELPPHTRRLLDTIQGFVSEQSEKLGLDRSEFRFTRRELRAYCLWGDTQLKVHLKRLVEHEYLVVRVVNRKHLYECLYNGQGKDGRPFLMGLKESSLLRGACTTPWSGSEDDRSGDGRAMVGSGSGIGRDEVQALNN